MKFFQIHLLFVFFGILFSFQYNHLQAQTLQDAYIAINEQRYEAARQVLELLQENETNDPKQQTEIGFLKAKTYAFIASDIRGTFSGQDTIALFKAYQAYQEVIQMKDVQNSYTDSSKIGLDSLQSTALNIAGKYYKKAYKMTREIGASKDLQTNSMYKIAFRTAQLAKKLDAKDTLAHSIAAYAAFLSQDYPNYIQTVKDLIRILDNPKIKYEHYENLIATCRDVINDTKETLLVLDLALQDFPNDEKFLEARIALQEALGTNDEKLLNDAKARVKASPSDPNNYFNLAIVYQRLEKTYEALDNYEQCIRLDPSNFTAIYNTAGIYYNQGIKKLKEIDKLTFTEYQKVGDKIEKQADGFFQDSKIHFEKLYTLDASNVIVLKSLAQIYKRLKMSEKLAEIESKLTQLEKK